MSICHKEQGVYGSQYGIWCVLPRTDTIAGGPTKQDVDILNQLIQQEQSGAHYVGTLNYVPPQGTATTKMYGPIYYRFNKFSSTVTTPGGLYAEAQTWLPWFDSLYDNDAVLTAASYVPSTGRGTVTATIAGGGSSTTNAAWMVLSDPATNFQWTSSGYDYWTNNLTGTATINGVVPGTYRLSAYVLGQWGELRSEGVTVAPDQTTSVNGLTFTPENFGTAAPVWTIGTPDRSAHEFLHGHDANGNDFRNYLGQFDFWNDFASTQGQQTYYATAVGSTPATNNLNQMQLRAVGSLSTRDCMRGFITPPTIRRMDTTTSCRRMWVRPMWRPRPRPALAIHFTTTAAQSAQGSNAVLSLALAGTYGSVGCEPEWTPVDLALRQLERPDDSQRSVGLLPVGSLRLAGELSQRSREPITC